MRSGTFLTKFFPVSNEQFWNRFRSLSSFGFDKLEDKENHGEPDMRKIRTELIMARLELEIMQMA